MYIVISGGGKVGAYLAGVLLKSGNEVALIESKRETADRLSMDLEGDYLVIHGDGCDSRYQEDANIRRADVFVATTGQDDSNLVSCEIAMRVFRVPRCIARVNNPKNQRIFREVGIECVSSTTLIANLIEEEALLGSVSAVSALTQGDVGVFEIRVGPLRHHDEDAGVAVDEIDMPEGSLVVAISRDKGDVEVVGYDSVIYAGDTAVIVAENDIVDEVRALFRSL